MDTFTALKNEFADLKKMEKNELGENNDGDGDCDDNNEDEKVDEHDNDADEAGSEEEGGDDPDPLDNDTTDLEIEAMKRRVKEMEEEAAKIEALQYSVEKSMKAEPIQHGGGGSQADSKSIYVGNVDYTTTPEELREFFQSCGTVNRITILCDKWTGHPKGYAYIEFKDQDAVVNAMILNETTFKGRPLKISPKRTNIFGYNRRMRRRRRPFGWSRGAGFYAPRRRRRRRYTYTPYY